MFCLCLYYIAVDATDELIDIDLKKRKCKFGSEGIEESKMFRSYTQESCGFECMTEEALKVCGNCIPWNMPQVIKINC